MHPAALMLGTFSLVPGTVLFKMPVSVLVGKLSWVYSNKLLANSHFGRLPAHVDLLQRSVDFTSRVYLGGEVSMAVARKAVEPFDILQCNIKVNDALMVPVVGVGLLFATLHVLNPELKPYTGVAIMFSVSLWQLTQLYYGRGVELLPKPDLNPAARAITGYKQPQRPVADNVSDLWQSVKSAVGSVPALPLAGFLVLNKAYKS